MPLSFNRDGCYDGSYEGMFEILIIHMDRVTVYLHDHKSIIFKDLFVQVADTAAQFHLATRAVSEFVYVGDIAWTLRVRARPDRYVDSQSPRYT